MFNILSRKRCRRCNVWKSADSFSKANTRKDGLSPYCKKCESERYKKYRSENPEKEKARKKRFFEKRTVEEIREKKRTWHYTWVSKNKEKWLSYNRNLRSKNGSNTENSTNRRARISNNKGKITSKEWKDLCDKYGNKCLCCGKSRKLTLDHVIPLFLGGANTIDNAQPLCGSCNSSKGIKTTDYRVKYK